MAVLGVKVFLDKIVLLFGRRLADFLAGLLLFLLGQLLLRVGGLVALDQLLLVVDGGLPVLPVELVRVLGEQLVVQGEVSWHQARVAVDVLAFVSVLRVVQTFAVGAYWNGMLAFVHQDESCLELILLDGLS